MQPACEGTAKTTAYESLTDTPNPTQEFKSHTYTELHSDAWNEIFPSKLSPPSENSPSNSPLRVNLKEPLLGSPTNSNCNVENTAMLQCSKEVKKEGTRYKNLIDTESYPENTCYPEISSPPENSPYLENTSITPLGENTKENVENKNNVLNFPVYFNEKNFVTKAVCSQENYNNCALEYDYIQHGCADPEKKNAQKSFVSSHRPLPLVPQVIYEPLKTDTNKYSNKTKMVCKRRLLIIGGSLLAFVVLVSAVIAGTVLGLSRNINGEPRLLGVIQGEGHISGITALGSQLFVIRYKLSPSVYVYDTKDFRFLHHLTITNSSQLRAIVASPLDNCLYISDVGLNVIHRYSLSNNVTTQWFVGGKCYGLSLTSNGNLLVALQNTDRIQEYTSNGNLMREIRLAVDVVNPWQSVQLSSGLFVINNGNGGGMHRVCIVNNNGLNIWCYGSSRGAGLGQLNKPGQLAIDIHDNVFVADTANNRTVLLSPSLTHLGYITIPEHQMNNPWALHLDPINSRLYVGEWTSTGQLFVISV